MKERIYHITNPKELAELGNFAKDGEVSSMVSIWNVALRKTGKSPWDTTVFAVFTTEGRVRKAHIARMTTGETLKICVSLKYNPALKWCVDHLYETVILP